MSSAPPEPEDIVVDVDKKDLSMKRSSSSSSIGESEQQTEISVVSQFSSPNTVDHLPVLEEDLKTYTASKEAKCDEPSEAETIKKKYLINSDEILKDGEEELYSSLDRFGFIRTGEELDKITSIMETDDMKLKESDRVTKWLKMIKSLENSELPAWKRNSKFESRLFKGVPDRLRNALWAQILSKIPVPNGHNLPPFEELVNKICGYERQIDLDIERTMRNHIMYHKRYSKGQCKLFRVLVAYANYNPNVGYCQGMSTVTAFLLTYFSEEECFRHLVRLFDRSKIDQLYTLGFPLLFQSFFLFEKYLRQFSPKIFVHLDNLQIPTSAYTTKWFMVFFLDYPIQYAVRIWDLFLFYGFDILVFISVASIVCFEEEILKKDFEECMKFVNHLEDHIIDVPIDTLLKKVQSFWLKGYSRLKGLRSKYAKSLPPQNK